MSADEFPGYDDENPVPWFKHQYGIYKRERGHIVGWAGAYLEIEFDTDPGQVVLCHPTYRMEYPE